MRIILKLFFVFLLGFSQYTLREPVNETAWNLFFRHRAINVDVAPRIATINTTFPRDALPLAVDWQYTLGSVRDQGPCGSCWAFATLGALETELSRKTSTSTRRDWYDLSEQQLLDCTTSFGNLGCRGGYIRATVRYLQRFPVCSEMSYPYQARILGTRKCSQLQKCLSPIPRVRTVRQIEGELALQEALVRGPVIIAMHVNALVYAYGSGVFNGTCNGPINHAVLLVGYNQTSKGVPFWVIRNSWGTDWGERGIFRIIRGRSLCQIGKYVGYQIS